MNINMNMMMDHNHGGGGNHSEGCPMIMSFHAGYCETILWKSWTARTISEFVASAFAIFVLAFIYEFLKYLREKYYHSTARAELIKITKIINANKKTNHNNCCDLNNQEQDRIPYPSSSSRGVTIPNSGDGGCCVNISEIEAQKSVREKIFNLAHLLQTALHLTQVLISYLLMLVIMTFNYYLCAAVILGAACGYFCFGWIRQQAVDFNEHCH